MFTWKRFFLASGITLLLALMFIMLILPGIISARASKWVAEETGRNLEIESISINPFSLSVEVRKLSLSDADQAKPFASWDLLSASLSIASLYHQAPIIDELRLDRPDIHLERLSENNFNFSDLVPKQKKEEPPTKPASEPVRFSVNNLSINDGQIDLVDSSLGEPVHHTIRDLQLVLPSIGNLPYMVENPAQPLFRAVINDAPINLEGELTPFTSTQEMQLDLVLENIDLPFYLGYVPVDLPVELRNGKLSLDLDIRYRITAEHGGELELSGKIDLASLDIWDKLQEKLFFLPLLQVEIAPSHPLQQEMHLSALRVYNLEVQLKRDKKGEWNHARMAMAEVEQASPEELAEEKETSPFKLQIDTLEIRDGVLFFEDTLPTGGFRTVAREINIDTKNFSLGANEGIPINLSLKTDRDETLTVNGQFLLNPFTLSLQTDLRNLHMGSYEPYYHDTYSGPLGGRLGLQMGLSVNPEQPLLVSDGMITWQDAYMAFNEQEGLGVDRVDISGLSFDLGKNQLEIDVAHYEGGKVNFSRNSEGQWSFFSRNFPILAKLTENTDEEPSPEVAAKGPAFSYRIGEFTIRNWAFKIQDDLPATPAKLEASNFNLTFNNLAAPEKVKSPFTFSTTFQRKGQIKIKGTASLADQSVSLKTSLKRIPLSTFAPYVAEQANLVLVDGYLNALVRSTIKAGSGPLEVTYRGDVGISRFHLLDSLHREDLLKWNSLQFAGINGQVEPLTLGIESITLSDYFAKVLIDEDARLNLKEALQKENAKDTAGKEENTPETAGQDTGTEESQEDTSPTPDISIASVILQGGHVDFTDRSLPRPFHADMRELGGRIQGLSADPATHAEVDLRGHLRSQSPLVISGAVNPLAEKLFLDLKLNFNDIELSPLSAYSGTYVGYLIEKGKLNLALEYYLEDEQLKANNKVFLDQFSFGESVESEQATSLPVNLAVALLKDRNGEIHLDIPVSGSLDDPQFSIASVVWTVIKNLLVKAATSPFALLGALVGGGEEDFSNVSFEYGSARLNPAEQDKLQRMSQALQDRPSLEVEVSGFIDPDNDVEGYRREQLTVQIKRLKYLDLIEEEELPEGAKEEDVTISTEEYADYLWQVYKKADFPKPRSFIGMTKKLPETEMEKLIYTNTPVTQDHLADLAQARALAVQNFLVEEGQLERERIFLKKPDITAAAEQETTYRARVELGATVR
jgi:uncharacterized protein involved in outer membrane biogenesis